MSPGPTMHRVYSELKAQIVTGTFAPGERLDPARLAAKLAASTTPVRDALQRLAGERLIESLPQEGFRQPRIAEPSIRDLYDWSNDVLHVVLRQASKRRDIVQLRQPAPVADYQAAVADCFRRIAILSSNEEHRTAVDSINDRSVMYRTVEPQLLPNAADEIVGIEKAVWHSDWAGASRMIDAFHRRRLRIVPDLSDALRHRQPHGD